MTGKKISESVPGSEENDLLTLVKEMRVHTEIAPGFRKALGAALMTRGLKDCDIESAPLAGLTFLHFRKPVEHPQFTSSLKPQVVGAEEIGLNWIYDSGLNLVRSDTRFVLNNRVRQERVDGALEIIEKYDPILFGLVDHWITHFVLVNSPTYKSASHPHLFGLIYIDVDRSIDEIAISIVHEFAHQELFLINLVDRLVNSESDFRLVHAPYQGTERPTIGRLHSAHALFRMTQFETKIGHPGLPEHLDKLKKTNASFQSGDLTPIGWKLIHEIYS
jgi:hypothetical protein